MLRRIVSLGQGQPAAEEDEPMSPSAEDASPSSEPKSTGGLSSVFKGLTGSKHAKSQAPPPAPSSSSSPPSATLPTPSDPIDVAAPHPRGLPPNHMELFDQLRTGTVAERATAANGLRLAIADYPLNPVLDIWYAGKDLIEAEKPTVTRHAGWELLSECAKHDSSSDLERKEYFQTLTAPAHSDDFHLQLAAVVDLTKKGRDLAGFDYDVLPLLTNWLNDAYKAVKIARKQSAGRPGKGSKGKSALTSAGEDKNLSQLFSFILDVIKFNFKVADDKAIGGLILLVLDMCITTNAEEDLRSCIAVINAIVTYGAIPDTNLQRCTTVLSSVYCLVPSLAKESWHTIGNLCKSHHGPLMVQILLNVLRNYPPGGDDIKEANREVRGALAVLMKLLAKSIGKGYPQVPLAVLLDGLSNIATKSPSVRVCTALLRLVNTLLDDGDRNLNSMVVDEDWTSILDVAAACSKKGSKLPASDANGTRLPGTAKPMSPKDDYGKPPDDLVGYELRRIVSRLEGLLNERRPEFIQRQDCIVFFTKVHHILPDSAAGLVLDYLKEFRCCFPSDPKWEENLDLVLESFFINKQRSTLIRIHALEAVTDVYELLDVVDDMVDDGCVSDLVVKILSGISEETDTLLLQETVTFMVSVATSADVELFDKIVDALKGIVANDRLRPTISEASSQPPEASKSPAHPGYFANQSPSNVVTRGYVQMFMRSLATDANKATKTFNALVHIARSNLCETDARLTAMRLLFRLRADYANRVFITPFTESESLASHLFRTEASLARKLADDAAQSTRQQRAEQAVPSRASRGTSFTQGQGTATERAQTNRTISHNKTSALKYQQLWSIPDSEGLPEPTTATASPHVFSHLPRLREDGTDGYDKASRVAALDMASWLEAIVSLFHHGCDWELFSFILVHLPSQLSNHAIFRDAVPQIQGLRKLLCEQVRMNSFQEPPSSSGPRRPEVLVCLFHGLTMLLSYHAHFHKNDEDEIVRTFIHGLSDKTAICCVHALSICCHELPLSTSKSLVTILQKMSQIISRQGVAMHILEFLACLSRLHSLYSNFREDEYRIVFGICFRYLQTVRDNRRTTRPIQTAGSDLPTPASMPTTPDVPGHPSMSEDLPQYVYALAYHVITFWFLALKLSDRANQVGWIAHRLFTDNDGKQMGEEHAQITLDFMQRVAFSNGNDSTEDPLFKLKTAGEVVEKRWIIGRSIITIQQDVETGWAQITKRQPSGTSCFTIKENFGPPHPHQATGGWTDSSHDGQQAVVNSVLPSHLLVQLLSSIPQTYDSSLRPIPLPEEEAVDRAIKVFDRNSSVDGHKVGVVYIGEGQTKEAEILANVSGSKDYIRFLDGLGTLLKLKGATFNTQGLDREYDSDGQYTFAWRDRVTEIVFHVTTQMPTNLMHDPQCVNKKRHIGNDFVNIIFNDSGLPFDFDTFPSDFNYVKIVITPESRASFVASREREQKKDHSGHSGWSSFYKVQVMSKPGFPEISPAAETKMVSLKALPDFIRLLALNASVFSLVWANRTGGGEHMSSWGNRLRDINRLRDRYAPKWAPSPSPPPTSLGGAVLSPAGGGGGSGGGAQSTLSAETASSRPSSSVRDSFSSLRRSSVATFFTTTSEQTSHRSSVLSTATTDNTEILPLNGADSLVDSLDFSKWA